MTTSFTPIALYTYNNSFFFVWCSVPKIEKKTPIKIKRFQNMLQSYIYQGLLNQRYDNPYIILNYLINTKYKVRSLLYY